MTDRQYVSYLNGSTNGTATSSSIPIAAAASATLDVVASLDNLIVTPDVDDPTTIVAEGQIDSHTSSLLAQALADQPEDAEVALVLGGVTFVDSSGLRAIVRAHKRQTAAGGGLALVDPSEAVARLLDITGLRSELTVRVSGD